MTRVTDKISKTEEAKKSLLYSAHTVYNTCTKAGHKRGFIFMGKQKTKAKDRIITKVVCLSSRLGCNWPFFYKTEIFDEKDQSNFLWGSV